MLYSARDIIKAKKLLKDFEDGNLQTKVDSEALWDAKYAIISNLHPDTGNEIYPLFRLSAFVPANIPAVIGLNLLKPTTFNIVFFQTLNQSYNFGVNISNANQSNYSDEMRELIGRYILAVTSSLIVSLGSVALLKRTHLGQRSEMFLRFGNYLGAATAGALNLVTTRYSDATQGLVLKDEETREAFEEKRSKKAGRTAVIQGAISRSLIPLPIFIIPNMVHQTFKYMNLLPAGRIGMTLFNSSIIFSVFSPFNSFAAIAAFTLWLALPISIGVFPSEGRIHYSKLEPEFHNIKNSKGQKVEYFVYNRGL